MILAFLSSFPLFCSLLLNEFLLQQASLNTAHIAFDGMSVCSTTSSDSRGFNICYILGPISVLERWVEDASQGLVLMSALYLVTVNPLDLLNTIMVVHNASAIHGGENVPNLREFFLRPLKRIGFRMPLVTSLYALVLSCLTLLGLLSLVSNLYGVVIIYFGPVGFSRVLSGVLFADSFAKYMEWSAVWNMGIVISILEEKHGDVALGVAAYLSRGSRRKGLAMLVSFIWRLALSLSCLYFGWHSKEREFVATIVQVYLVCLGNVVKWSVFMVYYHDRKKRFLEKKIDVEEGKAAQFVKS